MATEIVAHDAASTEPAGVVRALLEALEAGDIDRVASLLAEDAVWINVTLPTVRGRRSIEQINRLCFHRLGMRFRVHFHHVAADGDTVLTDRSDALGIGRFEQRFWVKGTFEVRDGKVAVWRDSFDWLDLVVGLARGLAGALSPGLNRPWPGRR